MPTKSKIKRKSSATASLNQTQVQLKNLSLALAETAQNYVARLHREIAEIAAIVPTLRHKDQARIGRLLDHLQIKPHKGRRKDLKKIDLLIGELQELVGN